MDPLNTGMNLKRERNLHESFCFQRLQLIDSVPQRWKFITKENYGNATNLITLDKLTSTEIYFILISKAENKPFSNTYFENLYNDCNID